jgi:hypothetical protein
MRVLPSPVKTPLLPFKTCPCTAHLIKQSLAPFTISKNPNMARVILKENKSPNSVTKNRWDDWVPQDRVRKLTPENKELAAQLHNQMKKNLQESKGPKSTGKGGKGGRTNGSDFGSGRGSEERGSAAVQGGRVRRGPRDYDLEHVSVVFFIVVC